VESIFIAEERAEPRRLAAGRDKNGFSIKKKRIHRHKTSKKKKMPEFILYAGDVAKPFYKSVSSEGNSGFDLFVPHRIVFPPRTVTPVDHYVQAMTNPNTVGFWLLPRSSISKTPLRLANSIGLIDPNYRGHLIAALENTSDKEYVVEAGTRLMQIALPSLEPFNVTWSVDPLSKEGSSRGAGGFGSTGK
jgi:dUTP pyrophosphatase